MSLRPRIAGVDFSGARDAGKAIWIAEGRPGSQGLQLSSCIPASALPGASRNRADALPALVDHVATLTDAVIGFDFPFGLPAPFVEDPSWSDFLDGFVEKYPSDEDFRAACRARYDARELKRETDREARTPWSAYNLKLYRQTWWGIAHVLRPLVTERGASAVPMQTPVGSRPILAEACPASLLKARGFPGGYKAARPAERARARARRAEILEALIETGLLVAPPLELEATLLDNDGGDAMDAVLAALCVARLTDSDLRPRSDFDRLEARVYF